MNFTNLLIVTNSINLSSVIFSAKIVLEKKIYLYLNFSIIHMNTKVDKIL